LPYPAIRQDKHYSALCCGAIFMARFESNAYFLSRYEIYLCGVMSRFSAVLLVAAELQSVSTN
jgi:hypothetical protein